LQFNDQKSADGKTVLENQLERNNYGDFFLPQTGRQLQGEQLNINNGRSANNRKKEKSVVTDFTITKDINQISDSYPGNSRTYSYGSSFAVWNGVSYFSAEDGMHGRELWRSDGTGNGTYLFKDLNPGEPASNPAEITPVNDKLIFTAYSADHGDEPWISDGTVAGTRMMMDLNPGPEGSRPTQLVAVGNNVFFLAASGPYYQPSQLWKTDGSAQGTSLLLDMGNSPGSFWIHRLAKIYSLLFFTVVTYGPYGPSLELWRSDGTKQGTFAVKNFGTDFWGVMHMTAYDNKLYCSADDGTGRKLWTSDGTASGTVPAPGDNGIALTAYYNSSIFIPFQQIGNALMIFGYSYTDGGGLYKYDASDNSGMQLVKNLSSTTSHPPVYQAEIALTQGVIYFKLNSFGGPLQQEQLWRSDGTTNNTRLVKLLPSAMYTYPSDLFADNGRIYFLRNDAATGAEPWTSDGTAEGTGLLKDIFKGTASSAANAFTSINGKLIFAARDKSGNELWITNGTEAGTTLLKDINTHSTAGANIANMVALDKLVIFTADDGERGQELYSSDGSRAGTYLLKDLNPPGSYNSPASLLSRKDHIYFLNARTDTFPGIYTIYKTDGTIKGTKKIVDIQGSNLVAYNVSDNGMVYYMVYNWSAFSYEMWRTDGSPAGTVLLANNVYNSSGITVAGNQAFFIAGDGASGYELWKTDGSNAGTNIVKDIFPGSPSSYPFSLIAFNNQLYFGAYDGSGYYSFWKTDGREQGTTRLRLVTVPWSSNASQSRLFAVSNNLLYFNAIDYFSTSYPTSQLWRTDGTAEGTQMVKQINANGDAYPHYLTDVDGLLFFQANDGPHGFQLWSTNGQDAGTKMVKEMSPPGSNSGLSDFTSAKGRLFFLKDRYLGKAELWSSDGTEENTEPVAGDGLDKISIYGLLPAKNNLFISGLTYQYGHELYVSKIKEKSSHLSVSELKSIPETVTAIPFTMDLFPNPARLSSTLRFSGNLQDVTVRITDISGRTIWDRYFNRISQIQLPMDKLAKGLYNVTVNNGKEVRTIKLIKQ
jgi:trimeric autotransporter adhesin